MAVLVSPRTQVTRSWVLASVALSDAYTDFILSRQAKQCSPATLAFYRYTAGVFLEWLERQGVRSPEEVTARWARAYLGGMKGADTSIHDRARGIKTLLRFWYAEGYTPQAVTFDMPRVAKKRLLVLSASDVGSVLAVCSLRERALVLLMVDSGLRRAEVCALNWGDIDMASGLVRVLRGKGGKARSAVVGATARRALLAYRRTLEVKSDAAPLFQARGMGRFTGGGLMQIFRRLSARSGVKITPHSCRRTFVILSLRSGQDVLHLQRLMGHASLDMVQHYAQMVDTDLLASHKAHSPIENLAHLD